jgi:replicative DNA helicase Mcm
MASGKALLRKYIKKFHKTEIKELKSQHKQCKISIDYESLNTWLLNQCGQDFWEHQIYEYIDLMEEYFNTEHTTLKFTNVPERDNLHDLDATCNNQWILIF